MKSSDRNDFDIIRMMARLGYIAKGVIYTTVGILAASAVFGWFGIQDARGTRGAISAIATQPFGNAMLVTLVAGLASYIVWQLFQAIADSEAKGTGIAGLIHRVGLALSGVSYAALAVYAVSLTGWFSFGSDREGAPQREQLTASLMSSEIGVFVVGALGLSLLAIGVYQGYLAMAKSFKRNWKTAELSASEEIVATRLAQIGIGVRAVTLMIVGALIAKAAADVDPTNATGLGEALRTIGSQPFGKLLLAGAAFGMMCYGIFCFINSRYRAMTI